MKKLLHVWFLLVAVVILLCACSSEQRGEADHTDGLQVTDEIITDTAEDTTALESTVTEKEVVEWMVDRWVLFDTQELVDASDWIVKGEVTAQRYEWRNLIVEDPTSEQVMCTVITFRIEDIYKGEPDADTIEIVEMGGETDTTIYHYGSYATFEANTSYVVFLEASHVLENTGYLNGHNQGRYPVEDGQLIADVDDDGISGFDITLDELNALKAKLLAEKEIVIMELDRQVYTSQQALSDAAEWIVRGTVISQEYKWRTDPANADSEEKKLYTVTYLRVGEVYKGKIDYPTIRILEEGGKTDTEIYTYDGYVTFDKGSEYVVYLGYTLDYAASGLLLGHNQGRYLVEDDKLIADVDAEGVSGFDITLTELNELKAELMAESEKME